MGPMDPVKVLMVDEKLQEPCAYRRILERNDCQCFFASSQKDVAVMPELRTVDIVLSSLKVPGKSIHWLIALLSGSRASAFYSLRLEERYWWVPVLKLGKQCLGTRAFPPSGFAGVFDQLVKESRSKTMALSQVNCETFHFLPNPTNVKLLFDREGFHDFKRKSVDCGDLAIRECAVEIGDAGRLENKIRIGCGSPAHRVLKVHSSGGRGDTATGRTQPAPVLDLSVPRPARRVESYRCDCARRAADGPADFCESVSRGQLGELRDVSADN
jgi:hypothetical protein